MYETGYRTRPGALRDASVMPRMAPSVIIAVAMLSVLAMAYAPHPIVGLVVVMIPIAAIVALPRPFLMALFFIAFSFFRLHEVFPQLMPFRLPLLFALGTIASLCWGLAFRVVFI